MVWGCLRDWDGMGERERERWNAIGILPPLGLKHMTLLAKWKWEDGSTLADDLGRSWDVEGLFVWLGWEGV